MKLGLIQDKNGGHLIGDAKTGEILDNVAAFTVERSVDFGLTTSRLIITIEDPCLSIKPYHPPSKPKFIGQSYGQDKAT
jgi:hypothetical protein